MIGNFFPTSRNIIRMSSKNILVIGGGGREHSLCWKLKQSKNCGNIFCVPGNAGIFKEKGVYKTDIKNINNHDEIIDFCKRKNVDLTLVGSEEPLVLGITDDLKKNGISVFGPNKKASQLEGSKSFMKNFCKKYNIPTANYMTFTNMLDAKQYIKNTN